MRAKLPAVLAALFLMAGAAACGGNSDTKEAAGGTKIIVGSFGSSESEVLAQIYGMALRNAGANVEYRLKLGDREVVAPALEKGEIDLLPEYLGSYLGFLDKYQTQGQSTGAALKALQAVAATKGITVPDASEAADSDVIAVTKEFATKNSVKKISDLNRLSTPVTLAGPSECETRQTCLLGLRSRYGLTVGFASTGTDAGGPVTKKALDQGTAQIGRLSSSDPETAKGGKYVILADDKAFQQPGNIVPVLRTAKVTQALIGVLDKVSKALTTEKLAALNEKTDKEKKDPAAVAAGFIASEKL